MYLLITFYFSLVSRLLVNNVAGPKAQEYVLYILLITSKIIDSVSVLLNYCSYMSPWIWFVGRDARWPTFLRGHGSSMPQWRRTSCSTWPLTRKGTEHHSSDWAVTMFLRVFFISWLVKWKAKAADRQKRALCFSGASTLLCTNTIPHSAWFHLDPETNWNAFIYLVNCLLRNE